MAYIKTAKRWLQVLEKSDVIFFLRPYSNNLLKRTVKTPKMYFFDTGLVAYLTRYSSPEILANGAINGAILENFVVSELLKSYHNNARECLLWYYRDSNANEIDMVIFLRDPLSEKLHEPDINNVMRLCDMHNIPLATNLATAELLIKALERGDMEWRENVH